MDRRVRGLGISPVGERPLPRGKPRKSNRRDDDKPNKRGRGTDKTPVVGIVERHGRAIAKAFTRTKLNAENLKQFFMTVVDADGSILMTDEYKPSELCS